MGPTKNKEQKNIISEDKKKAQNSPLRETNQIKDEPELSLDSPIKKPKRQEKEWNLPQMKKMVRQKKSPLKRPKLLRQNEKAVPVCLEAKPLKRPKMKKRKRKLNRKQK